MSRAKTRAQLRKEPQPRTHSGTESFFTANKLKIVFSALLAAATIALYSPATGYSFIVLDDRDYVTGNPHIHDGLGWDTIKWAFTSTYAANWHPLTWLSHALDVQLFTLDPSGHHFDSVLIHVLNVALLCLLLAWITERLEPSLLVAALFAVHPINVESVAWVAERKNVLSTLFFLLAIGAYVQYARRPDWRRYLLVAALFAIGLMAKPMVITLPFVLLLLDYWPLDRMLPDETPGESSDENRAPRPGFLKLMLEKIPLLFLSVGSAWLTLKAQHSAARTFEEFPFALRVENAVVAYGLYLWKMLWPARLAFYPHPVIAIPAWQWISSGLVLLGVTVFVVIFRRRRYLPVGWFWFLGTLVPVIGLVQVGEASMADRYAYIPLIGIFVMIAWGLADLAEAKGVSVAGRIIPAVFVLVALGVVTSRQMSYWESDYDLWSHTLAVAENPFAHNEAGATLMDPDSAMTKQDLEKFGTEQKRLDEARRHFERALDLRRPMAQQNPDVYLPEMATALNNLGTVDRLQNRPDEARPLFEGALQVYRRLAQQNPDTYLFFLANTLNNLGMIDRIQNRTGDDTRHHYEEALECYRKLAGQNPDAYLPSVAATLTNLGALDLFQNRMNEARQHCEDALKIYRQLAEQNPDAYLPDMAGTLSNMGFLDKNQNQIEASRAHYTEALTIYRQLARRNSTGYADDIARVTAGLEAVGGKVPSQ